MKKITFIELCRLISEKKQPKTIRVSGSQRFIYSWDGDDYTRTEKGEVFLLGQEFFLRNLINGTRPIDIIVPLDSIEHNYLSGIIRPFRDKVRTITKVENKGDYTESIIISFRHDVAMIVLPPFPKGKMYTLMETGKRYTVEELGL